MAIRVFGLFFAAFALVFIGVGATTAVRQDHKLRTYRPVPAEVIDGRVISRQSTGNRGAITTIFTPMVNYRYVVGDVHYTATRVMPTDDGGGGAWAQALVARYPAGTRTTAYYDPTRPNDSFLVRKYNFDPYLFVLFPMLHLTAGLWMVLALPRRRRAAGPVEKSGAGRGLVLRPVGDRAAVSRAASVTAAAWVLVGVVTLGHYFSVAGRPFEAVPVAAAAAYAAIGVLMVVVAWRRLRLRQAVSDARVTVDRARYRPGDAVAVGVEQDVNAAARVRQMRVGLRCEETNFPGRRKGRNTRSRTHVEVWEPVLTDVATTPGTPLRASKPLRIPADAPATAGDATGFPRYAWSVVVETALEGFPKYAETYLLDVRP